MKIHHIIPSDKVFPTTLTQIPNPPQQLFVLGNVNLLQQQPTLAIVGSRSVTPYGRQITDNLASSAARQGIVVVSGLALGVDGIAHRAALQAGGSTIAVLAHGLDQICPRSHRPLAMQILQQDGAIISEYPAGTPPLKPYFFIRNRLVTGLSQALLITEAGIKSGSLHSAKFALEQGRDVLAVPGSIQSPMSQGTNQLIKSGATPILGSDDLLDFFQLQNSSCTTPLCNTAEEQSIIDLLEQGITDGHELLAQAKLSPAIFNQSLTMLELNGHIKPLGAGHWRLRRQT